MFKKIHSFFHHHYHTRYHGIYKHAKQLFVFDLCLLALAIGMLGTSLFFFLWKPGITDLIELRISLGDARLLSGEGAHLALDYTNHSKRVLQNVTLAVKLPDGFILNTSTLPNNFHPEDSTFTIPDLKPGANGHIDLYGTLWSEVRGHDTILESFSYIPDGSTEREQKTASYFINLPGSIVGSSLTIASTTFARVPTPFTYTIQNNSTSSLSHITVAANYPLTTSSTVHDILLAAGSTYTLRGTLALPANATAPVQFSTAIDIRGRTLTQRIDSVPVTILAPRITSAARFAEPVRFVEPGQKIPLIVSWKNSGTVSVRHLSMRIGFTPGMVDLNATARENKLHVDKNTLVVDETNRTALANGSPGAEDSFTLTVVLAPAFNLGQTVNARFKAVTTMYADSTDATATGYSEEGTPAEAAVASTVTLHAEARYFTDEGDQLGRGPLPPAVGQTTKYWIMVTVDNTTNEIKDASFSATLPQGAVFTGNQSVTIGPELKYNPGNRTVAWSYSSLPPNSQTGLYFEVAVTPTVEQVGKVLQLTNTTFFAATDVQVGKQYNLSRPGLTNQLGSKDEGASKGVEVVE